ncbi:Origin recognition complex, subunit 5, partial [Dillenia turbinata]
MGKEETPQIPRRAARSSSSSNPTLESTKPKILKPSTLKALVLEENKILSTLDNLFSTFPCRKNQILELTKFLGPCTGKTSILLQIFGHLKRPFIYSSCRTCFNPRVLFESILNQLLLHRRSSGNGYSSAVRCEKPSDFVNFVKEASVGVLGNTSPDCLNAGYFEHVPVVFPDYTEDELHQIFIKNQENSKIYSSFLGPFSRITRRLNELSTAFSLLYKKYCEPLTEVGVVPNEDIKRTLFGHIQPHLGPSLKKIFKVSSEPCLEGGMNVEKTRRKKSTWKLEAHHDDIDCHMSISAKYLLVSAFLASRNPATLDASLFDSTGGSDNRKRKRKSSVTSMEKKETAEEEQLMKGPGTFPLERLLAIFQCITSVAGICLDEEQLDNNSLIGQAGDGGLMCDVLLQLSSLCNSNFISKDASCPLEGSIRYRSTVSEVMALKAMLFLEVVGRSSHIQLSATRYGYLYIKDLYI